MVVDQNSFILERPLFANKNAIFAKLSRTPCLSFAEPMFGNNASYEDSFITCQITPNHHGSLLDSLVNIHLASWNPFSRQLVADWALFLQDLLGHPPSKCTLTFARSFAELSRNFREHIPIRQQGCASGCGEASPLEARPLPMKGKVMSGVQHHTLN
jgi:hypothetical protein